MRKFQVTWELHNKHLFENLIFSEPLVQNSLPALLSQIRYRSQPCTCRAHPCIGGFLGEGTYEGGHSRKAKRLT